MLIICVWMADEDQRCTIPYTSCHSQLWFAHALVDTKRRNRQPDSIKLLRVLCSHSETGSWPVLLWFKKYPKTGLHFPFLFPLVVSICSQPQFNTIIYAFKNPALLPLWFKKIHCGLWFFLLSQASFLDIFIVLFLWFFPLTVTLMFQTSFCAKMPEKLFFNFHLSFKTFIPAATSKILHQKQSDLCTNSESLDASET